MGWDGGSGGGGGAQVSRQLKPLTLCSAAFAVVSPPRVMEESPSAWLSHLASSTQQREKMAATAEKTRRGTSRLQHRGQCDVHTGRAHLRTFRGPRTHRWDTISASVGTVSSERALTRTAAPLLCSSFMSSRTADNFIAALSNSRLLFMSVSAKLVCSIFRVLN